MCSSNKEHKQAHQDKVKESRSRTIRELSPRCIAEVDLESLKQNISLIRRIAEGQGVSELMMTLSNDAYGHGAVQCAKLAIGQGITSFGVSSLKEGIQLREGGVPPCKIIVLGEPMQMELVGYSAFSLGIIVSSRRSADYVCEWGKVYTGKRRLLVYVLVDTGETGIGIPAVEAVVKCVTQLTKEKKKNTVKFCGLLTHNLDETHHTSNGSEGQYPQVKLATLIECVRRLKEKGIKVPEVHFQMTPNVMYELEAKTKEFHNSLFNEDGDKTTKLYTRCGPQAFGFASQEQNIPLRKCLTLKGEIRSIRYVAKSRWIGLGEGWQAPVNSLVAIVAVGYGDGYPALEAHEKSSAHVRIKGESYQIIGEICSDHLMVHMGSDKQQYDISVGDRAVLFGPTKDDDENLTIEKLARIAGVHPLHILYRLGSSGKVSRHYKSTGLTRRNTFSKLNVDGGGKKKRNPGDKKSPKK